MKRRVASLPPVSVETFNQKVLERRQETAVMLSPKGETCDICKCVDRFLILLFIKFGSLSIFSYNPYCELRIFLR